MTGMQFKCNDLFHSAQTFRFTCDWLMQSGQFPRLPINWSRFRSMLSLPVSRFLWGMRSRQVFMLLLRRELQRSDMCLYTQVSRLCVCMFPWKHTHTLVSLVSSTHRKNGNICHLSLQRQNWYIRSTQQSHVHIDCGQCFFFLFRKQLFIMVVMGFMVTIMLHLICLNSI